MLPEHEDAPRVIVALQSLSPLCFTQDDINALLPILLPALGDSPDPVRALSAFARWVAACTSPQNYLPLLLEQGVLDRFCFVAGSSPYFADLIARHPDDFAAIARPEKYGERETPARRYLEISRLMEGSDTPDEQCAVLRRWKAREMLQIGARDLLGLDDMPTASREFSNLADACVQASLDIAYASLKAKGSINPLAVIALGKLGGQELNYSSDIDLLFVHEDGLYPQTELHDGRPIETAVYLGRLAENVIRILSDETAEGHVFRVDMRLRPEGRFGPLTRSLAGCRAYYEKWAENWERQALLKARPVAGDRTLGDAFLHTIEPLIYRRQISGAFLNDIRVNKRRIEQTCAKRGEEQTNIKTGYGGIRDIEFIVQLLQMEFGSRQPRLRSSNTLTALARLNEAGYLTDRDTEELAENYKWLRTLEHRLQLLHNAQTQTLPAHSDLAAWEHLARRMRYASREAFEDELAQRRSRVHAHLDILFYDQDRRFYPQYPDEPDLLWRDIGKLLDSLDTPVAQSLLAEKLSRAGFRDVPDALRLLALMRHSEEFQDAPPQLSERFRSLAPFLLDMITHSPDPDAALAGVEALAVPYRDTLYNLFRGRPDLMWRIVHLASVPPLLRQLARHQEWLLPLLEADSEELPLIGDGSQEAHEGQVQRNALPDAAAALYYGRELGTRIEKLSGAGAKWKMIALFYQRERLRIAARDVWDEADVADVMTRLTRLAEAMLRVILSVCIEARTQAHPDPAHARRVLAQVAIVGMGRLGGAELNYGSDWDLLFVYDVERPRALNITQDMRNALVSGLTQDFLAAIETLKLHGASIQVDIRLRPWGRQGSVILSLRGCVDYYTKHAQTWERQAALKARFVSGNPRTGQRLKRVLRTISSGRGITDSEGAEVQAMKARIEKERLGALERHTDLKLGHGGLSDIEWIVQRLQLQHGPASPSVRISNTLSALDALETLRALDKPEAGVLASAYRLLTRTRNAMTLLAGTPQDVFPSDPIRRRVLAKLLGYDDSLLLRAEEILQEAVQADMYAVRRIFERHFQNVNTKSQR